MLAMYNSSKRHGNTDARTRAKELLTRDLHQPLRLMLLRPSEDRLCLKRMIAWLCQQYCLVASVALFVPPVSVLVIVVFILKPKQLLLGVCLLAPEIAGSAWHDQLAVPLVWEALPNHDECAYSSRAWDTCAFARTGLRTRLPRCKPSGW